MHKTKYIVLILFTTFLMGIAFPLGKIGIRYAPPFFLMGIRFVLAGALLAWLVRRKQQPRGARQWLQAAAIGVFQSAGVMGCAYYSMRWITSGESSIITCSNPLIVIVLTRLLGGAAYSGRQWAGAVIGFLGVAVAFGFHLGLQPGTFIGLAGAFSFAAATVLIKRWGAAFDMSVLAAYQMLAGGLALLLLSALTEHPHFTVNAVSVTVLLCLVVLCSIVQFTVWFSLLRSGDPSKTSAFLFLVPLFGVLSGWLLLGEQVNRFVGWGGLLVCAGIFLVNREGNHKAHKPAAREIAVK